MYSVVYYSLPIGIGRIFNDYLYVPSLIKLNFDRLKLQ